MAATSSASVALASLPFAASTSASSRVSASSHRGPRRYRAGTVRCSSASPNVSQGAPSPAPPKPQIELEFVGPKPGADGSFPVDRAEAASGEKLLRDIMNENKIELYAAYLFQSRSDYKSGKHVQLSYKLTPNLEKKAGA